MLKQGLAPIEICQRLSLSKWQYDHAYHRLQKREEAAMKQTATIKANDSYRLLMDMAETAHSRREQGDGYRWIKSGVDALDVMGKQAGIGKETGDTVVQVKVSVPVLGPAQAGRAGDVVSGEVVRVIEGDTPAGSLKRE